MWPVVEDNNEEDSGTESKVEEGKAHRVTLTNKRWEGYGIEPATMTAYKVRDIYKAEAEKLGFAKASNGIYIPYPRDEDSRIRWAPEGFGLQLLGNKYGQRAHSLPALYVPPTIPDSWHSMGSIPIMITEGEFKAIVVDRLVNSRNAGQRALDVIPVAVGGVFNWAANKQGIGLIEDLKKVSWLGRTVYIAFDMDPVPKPMVSLALQRLSNTLAGLGAMVKALQWSSDKGKGIDDYLSSSIFAYDTWLNLCATAQFPSHIVQVAEMNARFTYCEVQQQIYDSSNSTYITPKAFKDDFFTTTIKVQTGVKNGVATMKDIPIGQYWMSSPHRATCIEPCFMPGKPRIIETHGKRYLNTWSGWGQGLRNKPLEPLAGDVKPFYSFLYATFAGEKPEYVDYLIKRIAWIFQQPDKKHPTWIYMMGRPFQGKSTLIKILATLIGIRYTANVDESIVRGQFAEWRAEKMLITFDDSSITDTRIIRQLLKRLTTEENSQVNVKYAKVHTAESYFTFIFATNSVDALLDHDDRRALVLEADCKWDFSKGEWDEFDTWRNKPESMQALLHHLLYEVKVDATFYTAAPPRTNARELVIEVGESSWDDTINYFAMSKVHVQWPLPATDGYRKWKPTIFTLDMLRSVFALRNGESEKIRISSATLVGKLVRYGARRCNPVGATDSRKRLMVNDEQLTFWTWDYNWIARSREDYVREYTNLKRDLPELFPTTKAGKY